MFICLSAESQIPKLEWVKNFGKQVMTYSSSVVDKEGNVYTTGRLFREEVDFNPGRDSFILQSKGLNDIFVFKLNSSGNFLWAKQFGSFDEDWGVDIALDKSGNVYVTGYFSETVDFDPSMDSLKLTALYSDDIFILKLNSQGDLIWVKQMSGDKNEQPRAIKIDDFGNVLVTGFFAGKVDFDPSTDTFSLTSNGLKDVFIAKLNPNGKFIWAKKLGGLSFDEGFDIVIDKFGNSYTTGHFRGTIDFDPNAGVYEVKGNDTYENLFILKLDSFGSFIWAKSISGNHHELGQAIEIDSNSNIYITGLFGYSGPLAPYDFDFDPSPGVFNLIGNTGRQAFILKLDRSGNFKWARNLGGKSWNIGIDIAVDEHQNVYTIGDFSYTANFNSVTDSALLTSVAYDDIFILKLDSNGTFSWVEQLGGSYYEQGYSIFIDDKGNLYSAGLYSCCVDFDPSFNVFNLDSSGGNFIRKLSTKTKGKSNRALIYPNPTFDVLKVEIEGVDGFKIQIINDIGQLILEKSSFSSNNSFNLENFAEGIYFIRVISDNSIITTVKIIKQ
jgi:hypothetical protein